LSVAASTVDFNRRGL